MGSDNGNGNGRKKTFLIICFYCRKKFELIAEHPCFISKVHCPRKRCTAKHAADKKNGGERFEKYKRHLVSEKEKYKKKKKFAMVLFVDKDKKVVFRENGEGLPIRIGELIPEEKIPEWLKDDEYVLVRDGLVGWTNQYRRDVIRGLS